MSDHYIADFVGSYPMFGCALVRKFEYIWSVAIPFYARNLRLESSIVHTIFDGSFDIAWKFVYSSGESGNNVTVKLMSIDNDEVDVFFSVHFLNIHSKHEYKICVMRDKLYKHQSSVDSWKAFIEDSKINDEYYARLVDRMRALYIDKPSPFREIIFHFKIEFRVMEMRPHVKPKLELSKNLGAFRSRDQSLSDVTFVVSEREFQAHKSILIARSPVFATMLSIDMKEKQENKIYVDDVEPAVFEQFLDFVYSGRVQDYCETNDCDTWTELLHLAEMYGLEDLKSICIDMIATVFSIENMDKIFTIANFMNSKTLTKAAICFLARQADSVKESEAYKMLLEAHPFLSSKIKKI